ncbi:MAG: hypothetical protein J0L61_08940 [Planctomycetes bacterium]|nr:hypothetical protein [Planctomycetota bacterium]
MSRMTSTIGVGAAVLLARVAAAAPAVHFTGAQGGSTSVVVADGANPGKFKVDLFLNDFDIEARVYSPSGTDRISTLTVSASQDCLFRIEHPDPGQADSVRVKSVDLVRMSPGNPPSVLVTLKGIRVEESIGSVAVQAMDGTFSSNQNILGPLSVAGVTGTVDLLAPFGSLLGNLAVGGPIRNILLVGTAGTASQPITISASSIDSLHAKEINAAVSAPNYIDSFWAQRSSGGTGHFTGSVATSQFRKAVRVDGTMFGSLTLTGSNSLQLASCSSVGVGCPNPICNCDASNLNDVSIRVGESFGTPSAPTFISIGGDIRSQIIFNDRNLSGQTFNGLITAKAASASPVTVTAAQYSQTAASLGGGGAGLTPFPAHYESCQPVHNTTVSGGSMPTPTRPVVVRHYSHVTSAAEPYVFGAMPVTVARRKCGTADAFVDCSGCFNHDIDPTAPQRVRVYPRYRLPAGYEFRVRPVLSGTAALRCDVQAGADPAVADYDYRFCAAVTGTAEQSLPCASDLNGDGIVNTNDLVSSSVSSACPTGARAT